MSQSCFWYDGELIEGNRIELAIDDPGLIYGATVFTTLRVYQQSLAHPLTNWDAHYSRLHHSLQAFGWQFPDWERVRQGAEQLLSLFPVLRIVIFPDGREWITGRNLPADLIERQQEGVTAWLADTPECRRSLPTYKTGNYLGGWLALQKALQMGAKEAILVNDAGHWLETSTGNLWGWKDDCWWTPPVEVGILPGVARSQLIYWLQQQGVVVGEVPWDRELVKGFEAIAYTNSVMEVIPIHTILNSHQPLRYPAFCSYIDPLRVLFSPKLTQD
ncbi:MULTISPECIES: aminotransferase class IV [unclassified Coleofasciculus]|uniref:aminotransferase class IV n=1 Tax=unclassified Coleofasciculus TaxID=2692782 RepID=UPI00187F3A85|nr:MULTISPECIES: aminotransferase class IV [unclassified Coleofasciculus]MBE9128965.1 aminotransferase class IV [Coleofasciculus sp. LEGE 07081]MBE9151697.1 aminotransferase class IV [Coleofasciculus sp. LEGE 07092]